MAILSGYYGLYRPPFENRNEYDTSIYIIANRDKSILILIPLVTNFFHDAYNIIRRSACTKVYLATPSVDVMFISDIYNLYYETKNLNKDFTLLCKKKPTVSITDEFMTHVKTGDHHVVDFSSKVDEESFPMIDFVDEMMPIARNGYDIVVWDGNKRIYFANYMSERKLNKKTKRKPTLFDELHIPFNINLYGGLTYLQIAKLSSSTILRSIRVHSFSTTEELDYARSIGVTTGEVI